MKSNTGEKLTTPLAFTNHVPKAFIIEFWTLTKDKFKSTVDATILPSVSISLEITLMVTLESSKADLESLLATGNVSLSILVTEISAGLIASYLVSPLTEDAVTIE